MTIAVLSVSRDLRECTLAVETFLIVVNIQMIVMPKLEHYENTNVGIDTDLLKI